MYVGVVHGSNKELHEEPAVPTVVASCLGKVWVMVVAQEVDGLAVLGVVFVPLHEGATRTPTSFCSRWKNLSYKNDRLTACASCWGPVSSP